MASKFTVRSPVLVPGFFLASMRILRQARRAPGAVGVSLAARPLPRTFFTLSAWENREALMDFVQAEPHQRMMERYRRATSSSDFRFWTISGDELPLSWEEARRRLNSAGADLAPAS